MQSVILRNWKVTSWSDRFIILFLIDLSQEKYCISGHDSSLEHSLS